jgi:HemY protein
MIRLIVFLALLAALALGVSWLVDRPGEIVLTWQGMRIETSLLVGLAGLLGCCVAFLLLWTLLRFVFRLPSLVALTTRARRRSRGYAALSRGMIAAAAGDSRYAMRATRDAEKLIGEDPLTLLLRAQTAQLEGDRRGAESTFSRMVERPETRLLGLRGLHAEAARRGDDHAAHLYAQQAHRITPLAWAGEALLDWHVRRGEWRDALDIVETNRNQKAITREQADRQRAVLLTAKAREETDVDPEAALRDARAALKAAPGLVPAAVIAGELMARRNDLRKAARLLEAAWREAPHPDIAHAYVNLRAGDAARERLTRAQHLAALNPRDNESAYTVARAALEAREFGKARDALSPLLAGGETRPSRRLCLLMADLEQTEHGPRSGALREWLARAARAPRDAAWIADGVISNRWEPASPVTGKLDAFRWAVQQDQLGDDEPLALLEDAEPEADPLPSLPPMEASPVRAPEPEPAAETQAAADPAPPKPTLVKTTAQALYPMPHSPDDPGLSPQDEAPAARRPFA